MECVHRLLNIYLPFVLIRKYRGLKYPAKIRLCTKINAVRKQTNKQNKKTLSLHILGGIQYVKINYFIYIPNVVPIPGLASKKSLSHLFPFISERVVPYLTLLEPSPGASGFYNFSYYYLFTLYPMRSPHLPLLLSPKPLPSLPPCFSLDPTLTSGCKRFKCILVP